MNIETDGNTITLSGDMTFDYEQMKQELAGRHESLFGDVKKLIPKLLAKHPKLTIDDVTLLSNYGTDMTFYDKRKIYCYFCVRPSDYANYMFSPSDSENRDNRFVRIRMGVRKFFLDDFDVYIIPCS